VTDGGSEITGYLVTASSGQTCATTTTSCVIDGLTNGVAYTFTVVANNQIGDSEPSAPTLPATPSPASFAITFAANGGSTVVASTFLRGGTVSQPAAPTRSGYTFAGWSLVLDDASTKVTFPYTPQLDRDLTLFALWEVVSTGPTTSRPVLVAPPGAAAGTQLPVVEGQTRVWTRRISATEVKVYIKFPTMGARYDINFQKDGGRYVNRMRRIVNTTADPGLRVVGDWYYLVRTITLPGTGRYRIEVTQDGERVLLNGKTRPVVYRY
jgi:uncharacterized repeat protein (TIGR02543 family)